MAARIQRDANTFGMELTPGERELLADTNAVMRWFALRDLDEWQAMPFTPAIRRDR